MGQELGIAVLEAAVKACAKEIEKQKGKLVVKEAPRAVCILPILSWLYHVTMMGLSHFIRKHV
jgi:hypothetical protein